MKSEGQKADQTLEAVRERADKFQSIFENSTMGIFQSSPEGRFLTVNPAFAGILGYDSPEDLIDSIGDMSLSSIIIPSGEPKSSPPSR